MRIGIVGSGIAGLTAGWLFHQSGADVTIFEKQSELGMDAHRVNFDIQGHLLRTDVPPRMFNSALWPNLSSLYRMIGVEIATVEPSKTFGNMGQPALLKLGASYQPRLSPNLVLDRSARQILKDIGRMLVEVPSDLNHPFDLTMGDYLKQHGYSQAFKYQFLYPSLSSTVCTCSYESLDAYPAVILLNAMLEMTHPGGLFRTRHGTLDVVQRLTANISDVRFGTSVRCVHQTGNEARVETVSGETIKFDQVIVATQANAAAGLMPVDSCLDREMLQSFRYETVSVIVHTDDSLMPVRSKDWSHFNLLSNAECSATMCTIWMNRFCPQWDLDQPVFQTIMPLVVPRPDSVIGNTVLQRPVVDSRALRGLKLLSELHDQPNRRVWFCGSYASPGLPLLESGVVSSLEVAQNLGVDWPDFCSV
jgi:predicted NAD/FAD-binding protein